MVRSDDPERFLADHKGDAATLDSLGYLSVDSVHKPTAGCGLGFCDSCFTGTYPIPAGRIPL